jgi:hypothetical protein
MEGHFGVEIERSDGHGTIPAGNKAFLTVFFSRLCSEGGKTIDPAATRREGFAPQSIGRR